MRDRVSDRATERATERWIEIPSDRSNQRSSERPSEGPRANMDALSTIVAEGSCDSLAKAVVAAELGVVEHELKHWE